MSRHFYHLNPDILTLETRIVDAEPGRVLLAGSPFFAGGGGQLADRGIIRWNGGEVAIAGFEPRDGQTWILLAEQAQLSGDVEAVVDGEFRQMMRELHTDAHLLNALVYQNFNGALVTGVQLNADGTGRMDFDLPEAENDRLRALDGPVNDAIRQDVAVTDSYISVDDLAKDSGLVRTRSVAPPPAPDGAVRIVDIAGIDRQACGGTHLGSTGQSRPLRILKIENKGRHNRRIKFGLVGVAPGT
jgi:misacylated tRNA(Ala) deacylase